MRRARPGATLAVLWLLAAAWASADVLQIEAYTLETPAGVPAEDPQFSFWRELERASFSAQDLVGSEDQAIQGLRTNENPDPYPRQIENYKVLFEANPWLIAAVWGSLEELDAAVEVDAHVSLWPAERIAMPFRVEGRDWLTARRVFQAAVPCAMASWGIQNDEESSVIAALLSLARGAVEELLATPDLTQDELSAAQRLEQKIADTWELAQRRDDQLAGGDPLAEPDPD